MFIVIVLYSGDVEFVKMCVDEDHARNELADWCCENWQDEEQSYEDYSTNDVIEFYFDQYEDYSYYKQPIVPAVEIKLAGQAPKGEDIFVTPGMCAVLRNGLAQVQYGNARELMQQHDEWEEGEDGSQVVSALLDQLE